MIMICTCIIINIYNYIWSNICMTHIYTCMHRNNWVGSGIFWHGHAYGNCDHDIDHGWFLCWCYFEPSCTWCTCRPFPIFRIKAIQIQDPDSNDTFFTVGANSWPLTFLNHHWSWSCLSRIRFIKFTEPIEDSRLVRRLTPGARGRHNVRVERFHS